MERKIELPQTIKTEDVLRLLINLLPVQSSQTFVKSAVTLRAFREQYLNHIKNNRSRNYYSSVSYSIGHLINYFGDGRDINSITLKDIEDFITHLQQKAGRGYRVYYRTLKAAFSKALDWEYVNENLFKRVKLQKKIKAAPPFITRNQLEIICNEITNRLVKDITITAFFSGMRLNEIMNLKWKNVNANVGIITVGDEDFVTKGRNQRYIPICEEITGILDNPFANPERYVFAKKDGTKFCGNYISRLFKIACRKAGIPANVHFHTLRHSFASYLVQQGVPLYTIKELMGHASISTTEIYSHLNVDALREAIGKFEESSLNLPLTKGKVKSCKLKVFRIDEGGR